MSEQLARIPVLYQGGNPASAEYSYHFAALTAGFGIPAGDSLSMETHEQLFRVLANSPDGARAVSALSSSTEGPIDGSYDQIWEGQATITDITDVEVKFSLFGLEGTERDEIEFIHSQAPVFGQCREKLKGMFPNVTLVPEHDSSESAFMVRDMEALMRKKKRLNHVAIAPPLAGRAAGLATIEEDVKDESGTTSFVLLEKGKRVQEDATVTFAALEGIGYEETGAQRRKLLVAAGSGELMLLHKIEEKDSVDRLIVAINSSEKGPAAACEELEMALNGLYGVRILGGYTPSAAS